MAERLGSGLQHHLQRFESARYLKMPVVRRAFFYILVKNYLMNKFLVLILFFFNFQIASAQCQYTLNNLQHVNCNSENTGTIDITLQENSSNISWNGPNNFSSSSANLSSLFAGKYFLQISNNSSGCNILDSIIVLETIEVNVDFNVLNLCDIGDSADITVSVFGGTPPYTNLWSTGDTSRSLYNVPSNTPSSLTLDITDLNGCLSQHIFEINPVEKMEAFMSTNNVICKDDLNGSARVYVSNGVSPFIYMWNNDTTTILKSEHPFSRIENLSPGDYFVEIIDDNGCIEKDNFTISYNPKICLNPKKVFSPNNDGTNDFWLIENIHIYPNALIEIYSKNGTQVFRRRNYTNSFDNGFKGVDSKNNILPSGTYYFIIQLDNENEVFKGSLTIVR